MRRRFEHHFDATHAGLAKAIRGSRSAAARSGAAAVLLHRLMFVAFLECKGLLREAPADLGHQFSPNWRKHGTASWYRRVLRPLFIELGLASAHSMADLDVPDDALAPVFAFLDSYAWILGERQTDAGNEIDRSVLGSLLEQYVNRQQMGAYYTGADVTGYMAGSTILAHFLTSLEREQAGALMGAEACWRRLAREPERYLYRSMRHGLDSRLPRRIAIGLRDPAKRAAWDEPALPQFALPTETWREAIARQQHCRAVQQRLRTGQFQTVDDLIACNVDLGRFATDVLESCTNPAVIAAAYRILERTRVLDPTCGSGAFLLAALRVLEPLYDACLRRMEQLAEGREMRCVGAKDLPAAQRRAYIIRSVLEHNLHGVDVMPEAIEVCRLRLLLELAATLQNAADVAALRHVCLHLDTGDSLAPRAHKGEFDVVIGNPPYVEVSGRARNRLRHFELASTGNLFSICMERFEQLLRPGGTLGVIVPISAVCTPRMLPLMRLLRERFSPLHIANFAVRPGKLFVGVDMNLSIVLGHKNATAERLIYTTRYQRWQPAYRAHLFETLQFTRSDLQDRWAAFPKVGSVLESAILTKLQRCGSAEVWVNDGTDVVRLYCHSGGRYFRKCLLEPLSNEYKAACVPARWADSLLCLFSSSLYYWFWIVISDCYHLTRRDLVGLPIAASLADDARFARLAKQLLTDLWAHASSRTRLRADGSRREEINFDMAQCRGVLDAIDRVLAEHYGLSAQETDFILSYDAKFRKLAGE